MCIAVSLRPVRPAPLLRRLHAPRCDAALSFAGSLRPAAGGHRSGARARSRDDDPRRTPGRSRSDRRVCASGGPHHLRVGRIPGAPGRYAGCSHRGGVHSRAPNGDRARAGWGQRLLPARATVAAGLRAHDEAPRNFTRARHGAQAGRGHCPPAAPGRRRPAAQALRGRRDRLRRIRDDFPAAWPR